jgi:oligopeptide transport system permease protein
VRALDQARQHLTRRGLGLTALSLALFAGLCRAIGLGPSLATAGFLSAIVLIAWLPPAASRALGASFLALLLATLLRPLAGNLVGVGGAALAALAAHRWAPAAVLRRLSFTVPSLVFLVFATTLLMYLAPGNPFAKERVASPEVEAALRAQYGVPEDAFAFFQIYMRRLLVDGSFGPSIKVQGRMVESLILPALPVSLSLGALSLTLAVALGLALGVGAGLRPGSRLDFASMSLAMLGISLPNFVIGSLLVIVFALRWRLVPVAGWGGFRHLLLPTITLALPYVAYVARLARSGTIEVMQQDFIRTARAKGLPEHRVVLGHALKGAVMPVVSFLGPAAAGILTGSFVVESLFGIPGMGQWFVKGAINRDYSVVLGTAIIYASLVTLFNLLVDLAYAWLDPRLRSSS